MQQSAAIFIAFLAEMSHNPQTTNQFEMRVDHDTINHIVCIYIRVDHKFYFKEEMMM